MSKNYGTVLVKADPKEVAKKAEDSVYDLQNGWATLVDERDGFMGGASDHVAQKFSRTMKTLALSSYGFDGDVFQLKLFRNGKEIARHEVGGFDVGYNPVEEAGGRETLREMGYSEEEINDMDYTEPPPVKGDPKVFLRELGLPEEKLPALEEAFSEKNPDDAAEKIEHVFDFLFLPDSITTAADELSAEDLSKNSDTRKKAIVDRAYRETEKEYARSGPYPNMFLFQDPEEKVKKSQKRIRGGDVKYWRALISLFEFESKPELASGKGDPYYTPETYKEELHQTQRDCPKRVYIEYRRDTKEILLDSEFSASGFAYDFERILKAPVLYMQVTKNDEFLIGVWEKDITVTEGKKKGKEYVLPDVSWINQVLESPITPQELEEVFQLEDQQAFYRAMEKLLGAVIYPDDDRLGKEFHCVTNDMWMGLYEEKSEGDS